MHEPCHTAGGASGEAGLRGLAGRFSRFPLVFPELNRAGEASSAGDRYLTQKRLTGLPRVRNSCGMREQQRVAIVGAGFSGAALAAHLLARESDQVHVTLIEASGRFGRGVAYGTHCAEHLLNTRADRMSLLAEDPEHFVRWCRGRGLAIGHADFAPRRIYGDYVEHTLRTLTAGARARCATLLHARVAAIEPATHGFELRVGRRPRAARRQRRARDGPPAAGGSARALVAVRRAALRPRSLVCSGARRRSVRRTRCCCSARASRWWTSHCRSRHAVIAGASTRCRGAVCCRARTRRSSNCCRAICTRSSSGASRAATCAARCARCGAPSPRRKRAGWTGSASSTRCARARRCFGRAGAADRRRFVERLRPYWDVHRHRLPPCDGRSPAKSCAQLGGCACWPVECWARRRAHEPSISSSVCGARQAGDANATSGSSTARGRPSRSARAAGSSGSLLERGLLIADPLGLGYLTTANGTAFGTRGPVPGLHVLGPACRPRWWEHTAVPELRQQACALADELARRQVVRAPAIARAAQRL